MGEILEKGEAQAYLTVQYAVQTFNRFCVWFGNNF